MDTLITLSLWIAGIVVLYAVAVLLLCSVVLRVWDDMPSWLLVAIGIFSLPVVLWIPGLRTIVNGLMERQHRKIQARSKEREIEFYGRELKPGQNDFRDQR